VVEFGMWVWDYNLPKNWKPKTDEEWEWYLVRKINYSDYDGFKKDDVKKYFFKIRKYLDAYKRGMLSDYLGVSYE